MTNSKTAIQLVLPALIFALVSVAFGQAANAADQSPTNLYSPEYGEFTSAATAVQARPDSEKFAVNAQSIFPRLRRRWWFLRRN